MSIPNHDTQVQEHQVWSEIEALQETVSQLLHCDLEPDSLLQIERTSSVLSYAQHKIDKSPPQLLPISTLDLLRNHVQQANTLLRNFESDGDVRHLIKSASAVDSISLQVSSLPSIQFSGDIGNLREDVGNFRRSISHHLNNVAAESADLQTTIQQHAASARSLAEEIDSQKGRLDQAISQFQEQTASSLSQLQSQTSEVVSRFQQQFSEAQDRRSNDYQEALGKWLTDLEEVERHSQAQLSTVLGEAQNNAASQSEQLQEEAETVLSDLNHQLDSAKRIVNVVGNVGITGDYQRNAQAEHRAAEVWRGIAFVFFAAGAVAAVLALVVFTPSEFTIEDLLRRIAVSLILSAPGIYAIQQSSNHREHERLYRSKELELASLEPFIALLPVEWQQAMKVKLADRYFTGNGAATEIVDLDGIVNEMPKSTQ